VTSIIPNENLHLSGSKKKMRTLKIFAPIYQAPQKNLPHKKTFFLSKILSIKIAIHDSSRRICKVLWM